MACARHRTCSALLAAAIALAAAAAALAQEAQDPRQLVAQLGDADPAVREAATAALWQLRDIAIPALEEAGRSGHSEIAARANLLLGRVRLGIGPDAPAGLVGLVLQARNSPNPAERSQARERLANTQGSAASAIARIIRDHLAGDLPQQDQSEQVLRELWPENRWALARVVDELSRQDEEGALLAWLEHAAAEDIAPVAAPHFAFAAQQGDDVNGAITRWRDRAAAEPSPENRRTLACLLLAAGDPEARETIATVEPSGPLLPVAWALLVGDEALAREWAAKHPDELTRLALDLLLARAADDAKQEEAAAVRVRRWLAEHAEAVRESVDVAEPGEDSVARARRVILVATLVNDFETAFALADKVEAAGLVRVLYRRLEFNEALGTVARHAQRNDPQRRGVEMMQRRMMDELRSQRRGSRSEPSLSSFARRRIAAGDALSAGQPQVAAALFGELAQVDDCDPALRWAWGAALEAAGDEAAGQRQRERALFMPLADSWVRRGVAEQMWLAGQREAALEEFALAAKWSTLVPMDALPALEAYADRLAEVGRYQDAARTLAATLALMLADDLSAHLADLDRNLYFACFLAAELERSRMNLAAEAGDWDAAAAALRRCLEYLPQSDAPIDLITRLDAAGRQRDADKLFIEAFTPMVAATAQFRQSSLLNNQAAWLAVSCNRRLDTAQNLAEAAVAYDPRSASALDTLAEVYLRQGQPQKALEQFERILALAESADTDTSAPFGQLNDYLARRESFLRRINAPATAPARE